MPTQRQIKITAWSVAVVVALAGLFLVTRLITKRLNDPSGCVKVSALDSTGAPVDRFWMDLAAPVHDAACRHDYTALERLMDKRFNGSTPDSVIAEWRRADPRGEFLDALTQTMETPAMLDQGGLTFCGNAGVASVFARGTRDIPASWTSFDITRTNPDIVECRR